MAEELRNDAQAIAQRYGLKFIEKYNRFEMHGCSLGTPILKDIRELCAKHNISLDGVSYDLGFGITIRF